LEHRHLVTVVVREEGLQRDVSSLHIAMMEIPPTSTRSHPIAGAARRPKPRNSSTVTLGALLLDVFPEDFSTEGERLPRALSETVMAQLEHPDNLARWGDPAKRLVTLVMMRCGLRIGDALRLSLDCIAVGDSRRRGNPAERRRPSGGRRPSETCRAMTKVSVKRTKPELAVTVG
jgi:integrase